MWIKNIRLVDSVLDFFGEIKIGGSQIIALGEQLSSDSDALSFEGNGLALLPAFTDLHVHFRDPGLTHKEDLQTGSMAALHGGYTAVNLMPNTRPIISSMELVEDVHQRAKALDLVTVNQTLSMTKNLHGIDYQYLEQLEPNQVLFVTDDGSGVNNDEVMEQIFKICKEKNITIMSHAEDARYSKIDMRIAENNMTFRDIELLKKIGGHLHFCHVSTKEAIEAIRAAQKEGHNVTCEVTPHHIFATGEEVNHYRVNPPFREKEDIDALIAAIQDGTVAAIATDHAPHTAEEKQAGAPGMMGLELAFSICYTALVKPGHITLNRLVELLSTTPSQMMKLNKGSLEVGKDADLVIVDLDKKWTVDPKQFLSKSQNSPFIGRELDGKIVATIRKGKLYRWN